MRDSPWYILILLVFIGGVMASVWVGSELRTVRVTDKFIEQGRGRYGTSSERYVLETDQGRMKILEFPLVGYVFGAEEVYEDIERGSTIEARIGTWPPGFLGGHSQPVVMSVR